MVGNYTSFVWFGYVLWIDGCDEDPANRTERKEAGSWQPTAVKLGRPWPKLGRTGANLGLTCAELGPLGSNLGPARAQLGSNMAQLVHVWTQVGFNMRNLVLCGGICCRTWAQDRPKVGDTASRVGSQQWIIWTMLGRYAKCANYHSGEPLFKGSILKMPPPAKAVPAKQTVHSYHPRLGTFGAPGFLIVNGFGGNWLKEWSLEHAAYTMEPPKQYPTICGFGLNLDIYTYIYTHLLYIYNTHTYKYIYI